MYSLFRNGEKFGICRGVLTDAKALDTALPQPRSRTESKVDYVQWKRFMETGELRDVQVENTVSDSWQRCREMEVDHSPRSCWDFTPLKQMESFTSTLEKICGDIETTVYKAIKGKKLLLTIANADARLARTSGDLDVLRQADKLNFGPGANWSEKSVGTNAIGTALVTGHPLQVFAEEHYCRSHHKWSCTAAPIYDPHGHIWGCFDISGEQDADHSLSLGLVIQAARALEQRLCQLYCAELEGQMASLFSTMFNSVMTGIVSIDKTGRIRSANSAAEALLGSNGHPLRGRNAQKFFDFDAFLAKSKHASIQDPIVLVCFTNPNLFVRAMPIFDHNGVWKDTVVTICEAQRTRSVAAIAARNKGISCYNAPVAGFEKIKHASPVMRNTIQQAANAARTPSTVLLYGESGTGKELFAKGIHQAGPRAKGPFIAVNCGAFSEELIQSELFGYCEGAFTGAMKRGRIGKFEKANKGVLFLDEISEMPLAQQVNLNRVLEERAIVPVGGHEPRPVDVKVIAATNRDLRSLVEQGVFREDLFYRLNVVGISIPPLRERGDDALLLARHHLKRFCSDFAIECNGIAPDAEAILAAHNWPGNVRELVNCLEYAVNNLDSDVLQVEHLPPYLADKYREKPIVNEIPHNGEFQLKKREADTIRAALEFYDGNISKTAKALGIGRNTLYAKMQKFNIDF